MTPEQQVVALMPIPVGLCQCGCGGLAPITKESNARRGHIRGQPFRFIYGHNFRRSEHKDKYRNRVSTPYGLIREHVVVAARALGRPLPRRAVVHHVDGNGRNNANSNLVICQDQGYHLLLHARTRVVQAGGNPNTQRVCGSCHLLKDFSEFRIKRASSNGIGWKCLPCGTIYNRELRQRRAIKATVGGCHAA